MTRGAERQPDRTVHGSRWGTGSPCIDAWSGERATSAGRARKQSAAPGGSGALLERTRCWGLPRPGGGLALQVLSEAGPNVGPTQLSQRLSLDLAHPLAAD